MMDAPIFERINVKDIIPTPDNPRKVNKETEQFKQLLESVKADGVKIPVAVRPHPTKKGKYDLRAGQRRVEAAKIAKLKDVPALVYNNMTDAEAFDLTFIENFAREDLLPLEEAEAVATLLEKYNDDIKAVAAKFGKSERWVRLRSNIHVNLSDMWNEELNDDKSEFEYFTVGHIELIARFDKDTQDYLHAELSNSHGTWTIKCLEDECGKILRDLSKALWDTNKNLTSINPEKELFACFTCPKRTSVQPMLWDEKPEKTGKADRCLSPMCWQEHLFASLDILIEKAKKKNPDLKIAYVDEHYWRHAPDEYQEHFGDLINVKQLDTAKKSDPDSKAYFVVCGKTSVGKVVWKKTAKSSSSSTKKTAKQKTLKEKQAELESKRWCVVLRSLKDNLHDDDDKTIENINHDNKFIAIGAMISQFGASNGNIYGGNWEGVQEILAKKDFDYNSDCLVLELFDMVLPRLTELFYYDGPLSQLPNSKITHAKMVADMFQIDLEPLYNTAVEECPEPKSWSKAKKK